MLTLDLSQLNLAFISKSPDLCMAVVIGNPKGLFMSYFSSNQ